MRHQLASQPPKRKPRCHHMFTREIQCKLREGHSEHHKPPNFTVFMRECTRCGDVDDCVITDHWTYCRRCVETACSDVSDLIYG